MNTEAMMETKNDIQRWSKTVLWRIVLFAVVYLLLIAVGIGLLFFAYKWATDWGLVLLLFILDEVHSGFLFWLVFTGYLGMIATCLMFGLFLVKFLFAHSQEDDGIRMEVTSSEYPEIFELIKDVSEATHSRMPYKVFLSPDVNANVSFNSNILSLFFPLRKNLTLGIGLFACTNTEEIKGILAHEFGHFSQNSMQIGTVVYTANIVLGNLVYGEDAWDRLAERWANVNWWGFEAFGRLTLWFTYQVRLLLQRLYRYVNLAYFELSRQMEYDADSIACRIVGRDVMASGFYKTNITVPCINNTYTALGKLAKEHKNADPFDVFETLAIIKAEEYGINLSAKTLLKEDIATTEVQGRFSFENVWDSHPSDAERVNHMEDIPIQTTKPFVPSWTLLPNTMRQKMVSLITEETQEDGSNCQKLSGPSLYDWLKTSLTDEILSPRLRTFFLQCHFIDRFNPLKGTSFIQPINPFTKENEHFILECITAFNDVAAMKSVASGDTEIRTAFYNGQKYDAENLPLEEHTQYVKTLEPRIKSIYEQIYVYLKTNDATGTVDSLYTYLFHIDESMAEIPDKIIPELDEAIDNFNESKQKSEDIITFYEQFHMVELSIKKIIDGISEDDRAKVGDEEVAAMINNYTVHDLKELDTKTIPHEMIGMTTDILNPLQSELWEIYCRTKASIGKRAGQIIEMNKRTSQIIDTLNL
jgi:Zn-dependent protease with chaperone function